MVPFKSEESFPRGPKPISLPSFWSEGYHVPIFKPVTGRGMKLQGIGLECEWRSSL